jgi:hypothetical protein
MSRIGGWAWYGRLGLRGDWVLTPLVLICCGSRRWEKFGMMDIKDELGKLCAQLALYERPLASLTAGTIRQAVADCPSVNLEVRLWLRLISTKAWQPSPW